MGATRGKLRYLLVVGTLAACGGGDDGPGGYIDARPPADASSPDAPTDAQLSNSCVKFNDPDTTIVSYPGRAEGTLTGASALLDPADGLCAVENVDQATGAAAPGPEVVIRLTGLTAGADYVVTLEAEEDLLFYVTNGCGGDSTFLPGECSLFQDRSGGSIETGRFTAPAGGNVFVVVDFWKMMSPDDGTFVLSVAEVQCTDNSDCTAAALPVCADWACVECTSDFHCTDPAMPVCGAAPGRMCVAGYDTCVGDDPSPTENGDDGPAGATDITPDDTGTATIAAKICSDPSDEVDYYKVTVTEAGASYTVSLDWVAVTEDLDLSVLSPTGELMGLSYWEQPESIALTYLPVGDFYLEVKRYTSLAQAVGLDYSLTVTQGSTAACASSADCAAEFRNQSYRGMCSGGACSFIDGGGAVALGGACDSSSDCVAEANYCTAFDFTADADTHGTCSPECSLDTQCGDGQLCHTSLRGGYCALPCTRDEHCEPSVINTPDAPPWAYPTCDVGTGRCGA